MGLTQKSASLADEPAARAIAESAPIRAALERLFADPDFETSDSRRNFLKYVVEETLAGRADRLKGVTIAQDVYGRGADFDQSSDPIVRIEAHRLRRDLDLYYAKTTSDIAFRFEIPKGAYMAVFTPRFPEPIDEGRLPESTAPDIDIEIPDPSVENEKGSASNRWGRYTRISLLTSILIVSAFAFFAWRNNNFSADHREPRVAVVPFSTLSEAEDDGYLARGLAGQLANDLRQYDGVSIYELPSDRTDLTASNISGLKEDYGIDYLVIGSLATSQPANTVRLTVQLRSIEGQVVWSGNFDRVRSASDLIALQDELGPSIAGTLGQAYGVIAKDVKIGEHARQVPSDSTYSCLMRANEYRRGFSSDLLDSTQSCLDDAMKQDPANSDVWAMRGWVQINAANQAQMDEAKRQSVRAEALVNTRRAVELEPQNVLALQAYSAALHYTGSYDKAIEVIREALHLRPGDPETLHQLGWRLAVRGDLHEGVGYIREALRLSVDPPGRYYNFLAIEEYVTGRFDEMLHSARISAESGSGVGLALLAIANAKSAQGSSAQAKQALERMTKANPDMAANPGAVFRRHGATDEIATALVNGLIEAGWRSPDEMTSAN